MAFTPPVLRLPVPPTGDGARFAGELGTASRSLDYGASHASASAPTPAARPIARTHCLEEQYGVPAGDLGVPEAVADEEPLSPKKESRSKPAPVDPYHLAER